MTTRPAEAPRASYRLQLNQAFNFADAAALAPYLARLGVSHVYLSPILKAQPGSTHGYDTVDHTEINPELGTIEGFRDMAGAFRREGLGIILDFVPNHMGVGGSSNPQWLDVLEWGQASRYADWFDIDWTPPEPSLQNKLLVPFLGVPYGQALESGVLVLRYDELSQKFAVWAHETHKLPVCPDSYSSLVNGLSDVEEVRSAVDAVNADKARLDVLIRQQHWRIADARLGADEINYRRFFSISELGGIRIEREAVFDHAHALIFQLIGEGLVDGLRIDHIDGLADPKGYCLALRRKSPRPIYLVVEKILGPDESLRADWQVDGTTGYEFISAVTPLLTEPSAEQAFTDLYDSFSGNTQTPEEIAYDAKLRVMDNELAAELEALSHRLRRLAASNTASLDLSRNSLKRALREVVAVLPIYRTYVDKGPPIVSEAEVLNFAFKEAKRNRPTWNNDVFDFLQALMTGKLTEQDSGYDPQEVEEAVRRIQQYSGPVMAKGLEDTALYRYNRLVALDEVGERPQFFSTSIASFHRANSERLRQFPDCMLTTSSHDTKRGEDTRARIAALTGDVAGWMAFVHSAAASLALAGMPKIDPNELYLFLQLLIGAWPTELSGDPAPEPRLLEQLRERLDGAMMKSLREARLNSDWVSPDLHYEGLVSTVLAKALSPLPDNPVLPLFRILEPHIALWGDHLSLVQTAMKLTVPGMPDIYQGAELWEQSLVDPDNRRPVDFEQRDQLLEHVRQVADLAGLTEDWRSGAVKLGLITRLLQHRAENAVLYAEGSYEPLACQGEDGRRIVAFLRRKGSSTMIVALALRPWQGTPKDFLVSLPDDLAGQSWSDLLRGRPASLAAAVANPALFDPLPVAILVESS